MIVALLHPGAMGATVGATLVAGGHTVRWLTAGRSESTRARAEAAGLSAADDWRELLEGVDGVVSVCPPDQALNVARGVRAAGYRGRYVDANAVAPATAHSLAELMGEAFVDGGIIGPPARQPGTTRLYLSGAGAREVAGWFEAGPLAALALDGEPGAASALKMCYAAYTKGSAALLLSVRALAEHTGVTSALRSEWELSQPGLSERSEAAARGTAGKAWRFVGEMEEIAATFDAAALPDGFHRAAAETYARLAGLKDVPDAGLEQVVRQLLKR